MRKQELRQAADFERAMLWFAERDLREAILEGDDIFIQVHREAWRAQRTKYRATADAMLAAPEDQAA